MALFALLLVALSSDTTVGIVGLIHLIDVDNAFARDTAWMDRHLAYRVDPRQVPPQGLGPLEAQAIALASSSPRLSMGQVAVIDDYLCQRVDVCYGAPDWRVHGVKTRPFHVWDACDWGWGSEEAAGGAEEETFKIGWAEVYIMQTRRGSCEGPTTLRFVRENRMAEE